MDRNDLAADSNWCAVFEFTGWKPPPDEDGDVWTKTRGNSDRAAPVWCVSETSTVKEPLLPFGPMDVEKVEAASAGEHDVSRWLLVGCTFGGLWFFLEAGCDYTEWDCQSSGSATMARSLEEIVAFALDDEQRERLGLQRRVA